MSTATNAASTSVANLLAAADVSGETDLSGGGAGDMSADIHGATGETQVNSNTPGVDSPLEDGGSKHIHVQDGIHQAGWWDQGVSSNLRTSVGVAAFFFHFDQISLSVSLCP
jgi:hypothetical protein